MGVGIECYADGDFEAMLPPYFSDQATYILGSETISTSGENTGSLTDPLIDGQNLWIFWAANGIAAAVKIPSVSHVGDTLSWTANPKGAGFIGTLWYGIH